jgi:hypothetical protein
MALERTLSIVKPDAVAKNVIGEIYSRFEKAGLKVVAAKMTQLSKQEAEGFYAVHRERPFFSALVNFMISGPVMIQVLEGDKSEGCRRGHDPRGLRRLHRRQCRARFRLAGERSDRNRVLLPGDRRLRPLIPLI